MLSKSEIENLIRKGEIRISYSFFLKNGSIETSLEGIDVNPDDPNNQATILYNKNTKSDRLAVTLGAVVVSHHIKRLKGRVNFKNHDYQFDLTKTNNEFIIMPGELISVSSNEFFRIQGNYGAYILPRLSTSDAGLLYFPSYIDPYWAGLMQAVIYNFSGEPISLKICERIAYCRFYKIEGNLEENFKDTFPIGNHHFGRTWENILEGSIPPVRKGKQTVKEKNMLKTNFSQVREFVKKNAWAFITSSSLLLLASAIISMKIAFVDFPEVKKKSEQIKQIAESNTYTFTIPANRVEFLEKQEVNRPSELIKNIWIKFNDPRIKEVISNKKSLSPERTEITFVIRLQKALSDEATSKFDYLLVN